MNKLILALVIVLSTSVFGGSENTGYAEITEIKVWTNYIDLYSQNDHVCDHEHRYRFVLDKTEKEMFSIALAAMSAGMKANINYDCGEDGPPRVGGIRVKP